MRIQGCRATVILIKISQTLHLFNNLRDRGLSNSNQSEQNGDSYNMNFLLALILTINILFSADIVFVANEGNYGASNGSISMIFEDGNVYQTDLVGDVVQALEVHGDKLIVLVNNSHKIKIYDITSEGLAMPGIEVSTLNSSPREMVVVNGMVYFTNWNTSDVKVFNLHNYVIEESILVGMMPEGIIYHNDYLWVANSGEHTISKINVDSFSVETINVGEGPQAFATLDNDLYISRIFYNDDWTETYYGSSKITASNVIINNYGKSCNIRN